jgi:hypothetical protein
MTDFELTAGAWAFISVVSIFFQNTKRHVLDTREIIRIAAPLERICCEHWLFD